MLFYYLAQENQYDVDFLLYRARVRGYVFVYYSEGSDRNPEEHVYFGPSAAGRVDEIYELEWGKSLIDFTPTLTTANQVKSVTVNGWDRHRKRAISEKAELSDLEENRDLDRILEECDAREEIVVNRPVFSQKDAQRTALALLRDRHKEMVKATGSTIGLPNLRAGRKIQINGLGARFSGTYFVTESTHTINDKGYLTKFKARREDESGYTEAVQ